MKIGGRLPNSGALPARLGIAAMAVALEEAGFDSVWVADHVVMTTEVRSRYPFARDGRVTWPLDTPYYDCLIALGIAAAVTKRVELGTAVLVLPMRNPVVVAKQIATVSATGRRRISLGVGAGWMAEEFEALGSDFGSRGARLDEALAVMRACWTGNPPPVEGRFHRLPAGVLAYPVPPEPVSVLIGGMSPAALRRAARFDGWLAEQGHDALDLDALAVGIASMRQAAVAGGRDPDGLRATFRYTGHPRSPEVLHGCFKQLADLGFDEIVIDVDWEAEDGPRAALSQLRALSAEV